VHIAEQLIRDDEHHDDDEDEDEHRDQLPLDPCGVLDWSCLAFQSTAAVTGRSVAQGISSPVWGIPVTV
jgi:hypothetical protein